MLSFGQLNGKKMNAKNPSGKLGDLRVGLTFDDVLLGPEIFRHKIQKGHCDHHLSDEQYQTQHPDNFSKYGHSNRI